MTKIILASNSPRRKKILTDLGLDFEVLHSNYEEKLETNIFSYDLIEDLATQKACDVVRRVGNDEIVLGADTVVVFDGKLLGKPYDDTDAENMLRMLSGQTHYVYTGVALIYYDFNNKIVELSFAEKTEVHFAEISLDDIKKYIATGNHRDKAGSYAIQDEFSVHINGINGDYNNVVGFPVARIYKELKLLF